MDRSTAASRRVQIDSLRAIAISAVLFDHFMGYSGPSAVGNIGVRLFLIVSGYLVTRIVLQGRQDIDRGASSVATVLRSFYIRRLLRIWPAYVLTLGLVFIEAGDRARDTILWHFAFLSNILFAIRDDFNPPWTLSHLWTLSVQEQFYVLWPLLLLLTPRRLHVPLILASFFCAIAFRLFMLAAGLEDEVASFVLPMASFDALSVGAMLAWAERSSRLQEWHWSRAWIATALSAFLYFGQPYLSEAVSFVLVPTLWLIPLAMFLSGASRGYGGLGKHVLEHPVLRYLGRISLGLYIYHMPVWAFIFLVSGRLGIAHVFQAGPAALAAGAIATVTVAALSWKFIEQPINNLKVRFPYSRMSRAREPAASQAS